MIRLAESCIQNTRAASFSPEHCDETMAYVAIVCALSVFIVLMLPKRTQALAVGTASS